MAVEATAPGKMILFGEHSVVYKGSSVVLAIDRRARVVADKRDDKRIYIDAEDLGFSGYFEEDIYYPVTGKAWRGRNLAALNIAAKKTMEHLSVESGLNLMVRSMIPIAVGLGSSAAVCVATVAAISELFDGGLTREKISELSFEGEKVIHGMPSGVDNNIATFGGVMKYKRGASFERFKLEEVPHFVIGNTRRKRSTRMMVEGVKELMDRNSSLISAIINAINIVSEDGFNALMKSDHIRIGELMNINHGLLSALGVSTSELDALVYAARQEGALGAKLTGAGGGGCMIALAEEDCLGNVERAIRRHRGQSIRVDPTDEGVEARRL